MPQISIKNLYKTFKIEKKQPWFLPHLKSIFHSVYEERQAVNGISINVEAWEKIAFIGPNGAWKSTTIKMLTWILSSSSWTIQVLEMEPCHDREKLVYEIGAVFGQSSRLWYHLSPRDTFELFAKLYDLPKEVYGERIAFLTESFEIQDLMNTPVRKLSLGQRMRAEVVASLLHSPKILFLDEPTIGLDIIAKQKLRDIINEINLRENTTIFLTSHDIGDIEEICNRVIIINHGSIIYDGCIEDLKTKHIQTKLIQVRFLSSLPDFSIYPRLKILKASGNYFEIQIPNAPEFLSTLLSDFTKNFPFEDISITEPSLEDIIKTFYSGKGI